MLGLLGAGAALGARGVSAQVAKSVDTLKVGISGDPGTLHPWITNGMPQFSTFWPTIYESILWHDDKMALIPNLAERWDVSGNDIKLTLRKGVSYHNGKPFDAESVKFAVEQITVPTSKSLWKSMIAAVKSTTIHDRQTITLHMEKPFRSVLDEPGHGGDDRARARPDGRREARAAAGRNRPFPVSWSTSPART